MGIIAKGPGGVEWEFDYPLPQLYQEQVRSNHLKIIGMTGKDARPEQSDSREEWVDYLVRIHGIDVADSKGVAKQELIEWANELDMEAGRPV